MVRRARSISTIIGKLASGNGAQRFPAQLRAVDVEGIRPRGNPKMLNQFVKDVLPRIKYHNEGVAFNVSYAPRKGTEKQKGVRPPPSETDDAQSKQEVKQRLLLHFGKYSVSFRVQRLIMALQWIMHRRKWICEENLVCTRTQ